MAINVFLGANDTFTAANNNLTVKGAAGGSEKLLIATGVTGVTTDANIERIELAGALSTYKFSVGTSGIVITDLAGTVVATIPSLNQAATVAFTDGSATLTQTGATAATLGAVALTSTAAVVAPTLNTADKSTVTGTTGGTTAGQSFSLTTAMDNITGSSSDDSVRGSVTFDSDGAATSASTFQAADSITLGQGTDTLDITVDGSGSSDGSTIGSAIVTSADVVSVRAISSDAAGITMSVAGMGTTKVVNNMSTTALAFNNIGAADATVKGNDAVTLGATTLDVGSTIVTDAFVLNIENGTKGTGNIYVNDGEADWTVATINSTGAANSVGGINVSGVQATASTHTVKDLTINAATALSSTGITGFDVAAGVTNTITITGAAAATSTNTGVSIGTLADAVDVVNASGLTAGGLTMTLSSSDGMAALKVTGGAGQDKITTAATPLATGASIDAAGGTNDTLIVAASTHITSTLGAFYKNFEVAQVGNGVTLDMNHLTDGNTISSIKLVLGTDGTDGATLSNVNATQAGSITVGLTDTDGTDAQTTIAVKNATDVGNMDSVKLTFDDGDATTATTSIFAHTDGGLVLAGVETLTLDAAADASQIVLGVGAAALTTLNLTGAKAQNVSFTSAYTFNTNTAINGSDATGALTINTSLATDSTAAVAITGGSKADTITFYGDNATDASDAAASTVAGKGGLDTINIHFDAAVEASDVNTLVLTSKIFSDAISSADADLVKFMGGTDGATDAITVGVHTDSTWAFKYTGALSNGTGTNSDGIVSGEIVSATTFAGALADGSAANAVVFKATNSLSTNGTSLSTLQGAFTQANIDGFIAGLVATGGSLTGGITGLDSTLGTSDAVLLVLDDGTHSAILRITNTDTAVANTLTTSEIALVGVISNVNDFGGGAASGTLTF